MTLENRPWWYAPLTIGAMQVATEGDPLAVADLWAGMGYNTEQLLHAIGIGYYACFNPETDRDRLSRYLEHAHACGLRIILYQNTHILPTAWENDHPGFFARNRAGGLLQAYNKHYAYVDCATPWRDWVIESTREAVALGVDGIFSDGPVEVDSYTPDSIRAFHELHAVSPLEIDDSIPNRALKRDFDRALTHRFVKDLAAAIKEVNRECLFYTNLSTASDPGDSLSVQDVIGSEGGFSYYTQPRMVKAWKTGFNSRILEGMAAGKPRVNFISMDYKPWHRVLKPGPDVLRQAANAVQHGSNYWIGWSSAEHDLVRPEPRSLVPLNRVVASHPEIFGPTRSLARVALYWSFASMALDPGGEESDFYARGADGAQLVAGHYGEIHGWARALIASQIPFDVIVSGLTPQPELDRYDAIVLPAACCLTPDEVEMFTAWVLRGGRLIVAADPGRLSPTGEALAQPALADLLGIARCGEVEARGNYNYISMGDAVPGWMWPEPRELLPGYTRALDVEVSDAVSLARLHEPTVGQYNPLLPLAGDAILCRARDKGQVVFFAGDIGETYGNYGLPALRRLMANVVTYRERRFVELENAPGFLEVSVRASVDEAVTTVHLVNHGGDFEQPLETPVELRDLVVRLRDDAALTSARALMGERELPVARVDGYLEVTLPRMSVYEAIVFS